MFLVTFRAQFLNLALNYLQNTLTCTQSLLSTFCLSFLYLPSNLFEKLCLEPFGYRTGLKWSEQQTQWAAKKPFFLFSLLRENKEQKNCEPCKGKFTQVTDARYQRERERERERERTNFLPLPRCSKSSSL